MVKIKFSGSEECNFDLLLLSIGVTYIHIFNSIQESFGVFPKRFIGIELNKLLQFVFSMNV